MLVGRLYRHVHHSLGTVTSNILLNQECVNRFRPGSPESERAKENLGRTLERMQRIQGLLSSNLTSQWGPESALLDDCLCFSTDLLRPTAGETGIDLVAIRTLTGTRVGTPSSLLAHSILHLLLCLLRLPLSAGSQVRVSASLEDSPGRALVRAWATDPARDRSVSIVQDLDWRAGMLVVAYMMEKVPGGARLTASDDGWAFDLDLPVLPC